LNAIRWSAAAEQRSRRRSHHWSRRRRCSLAAAAATCGALARGALARGALTRGGLACAPLRGAATSRPLRARALGGGATSGALARAALGRAAAGRALRGALAPAGCTSPCTDQPLDSALELGKTLLELLNRQRLDQALHRFQEIATGGGSAPTCCRPRAPHGAFDGCDGAAATTPGSGHMNIGLHCRRPASAPGRQSDVCDRRCPNLLSIAHSMLVVHVNVNDVGLIATRRTTAWL